MAKPSDRQVLKERSFPYQSLVDALIQNSQKWDDKPIFYFAEDGKDFGASLTYGELVARGRRIAAELSESLEVGDRALLLFSTGLDFVEALVGCILAGVIAVPTPPPRNMRSIDKITKIVQNSGARIAIYGQESQKFMDLHRSKLSQMQDLDWLPAHTLGHGDVPSDWQPRFCETVILQYTSGSTGDPKGVVVTHQNILANVGMFSQSMQYTEATRMLSWLPVYHDMGFIASICFNFLLGSSVFLYPNQVFASGPLQWLKNLSALKVTVAGVPNFAFASTNQKLKNLKDPIDLDLSHLEVLYCGSEPIDARALEEFCTLTTAYGFQAKAFYPCYGMAETTLIITGVPYQQGMNAAAVDPVLLREKQMFKALENSPLHKVSVGYPFESEQLEIMDPGTEEVIADAVVGEICVSGPHISPGYWNPADPQSYLPLPKNRRGLFRTGDLGTIYQGELYVVGRLKDLIIVNGRNIIPFDIEVFLFQEGLVPHPNVVAMSLTRQKEEVLLVVEWGRSQEGSHLQDAAVSITTAVWDMFEIPVHHLCFVRPGVVQKTTSGKINRAATLQALYDNPQKILWKTPRLQLISSWT